MIWILAGWAVTAILGALCAVAANKRREVLIEVLTENKRLHELLAKQDAILAQVFSRTPATEMEPQGTVTAVHAIVDVSGSGFWGRKH